MAATMCWLWGLLCIPTQILSWFYRWVIGNSSWCNLTRKTQLGGGWVCSAGRCAGCDRSTCTKLEVVGWEVIREGFWEPFITGMSFDGGVAIGTEQLQANEGTKEVWSTGKGAEVQEIPVELGVLGEDGIRGWRIWQHSSASGFLRDEYRMQP